MKRILLAAVALAAFAPAAFAIPTVSVTGNYTIGEVIGSNGNNGGPSLLGNDTGVLNSGSTKVTTTNNSTTAFFSLNMVDNGASQTINLATFTPQGICEGTGSNGNGCTGGILGTEVDAISALFNLKIGSNVGTANSNATFTAKYSKPYLGCDPGGDGLGKSDCVQWTTSNLQVALGSYDLNIVLNNASDWAITPTATFSLVDAPVTIAAPEPGTIGVIGVAMTALGYIRRPRRARA